MLQFALIMLKKGLLFVFFNFRFAKKFLQSFFFIKSQVHVADRNADCFEDFNGVKKYLLIIKKTEKMKKISLKAIKDGLKRDEMRNIMAGSGNWDNKVYCAFDAQCWTSIWGSSSRCLQEGICGFPIIG